MKFKFKDTVTGETMIEVASTNSKFVSNIFNLFLIEMLRMHGPTFEKVGEELSYPNGVTTINVNYTCNVSGWIEP